MREQKSLKVPHLLFFTAATANFEFLGISGVLGAAAPKLENLGALFLTAVW